MTEAIKYKVAEFRFIKAYFHWPTHWIFSLAHFSSPHWATLIYAIRRSTMHTLQPPKTPGILFGLCLGKGSCPSFNLSIIRQLVFLSTYSIRLFGTRASQLLFPVRLVSDLHSCTHHSTFYGVLRKYRDSRD